MKSEQPFISVIVPVHNGSKYIARCLEALRGSSYESFEIVVVDDASTDNTVQICRDLGVTVTGLSAQSGPASARNHGAKKARGEILLFIDSDVLVYENTVGLVARTFKENPDTSALFGSYDDTPSAPDFLSQYRNLLHHYVHQRSSRIAKTFWAGCGAVRRKVFTELNGFDDHHFGTPSIEDIEFGYRMSEKGYKIILDRQLQVKHLKHWGWHSLIKTDILNRAVPWSRLILESKSMPRDLNLSVSDRVSTILVGLFAACVLLLILALFKLYNSPVINSILITLVPMLIIALVALNRDLYGFFLKKRGLKFTLLAIPMHFIYYFYCGASFAFCWIQNKLS